MKTLIAIVLLVAGCTGSDPTSRKDAADQFCSAFCARANQCDPSISTSVCTAQCVGEACAGGCTGDISDEGRLDACLDAIHVLSCSASGLPGSCNGVIR